MCARIYKEALTPSNIESNQLLPLRRRIEFHRSISTHLPIESYSFSKMVFSSRILCLAAPLSAILCGALVDAMPKQTGAPIKVRQASTVEPDSDEDPDVGIDNTDKLRNGMTNALASL